MWRGLVLILSNCLICFSLFAETIIIQPQSDKGQIEEALISAKPYDTILFNKGSYHLENISINKPLIVQGAGRPTIESLSGDEIFLILSDSVTITGFHLTGVTTSYIKERAAIRVVKSKHFLISNNMIEDCFFGIYLEHVAQGEIKNNTIRGTATTEAASGNAIHAWYCNNLKIDNNEVTGHRDGIYFEFVDESVINITLVIVIFDTDCISCSQIMINT